VEEEEGCIDLKTSEGVAAGSSIAAIRTIKAGFNVFSGLRRWVVPQPR